MWPRIVVSARLQPVYPAQFISVAGCGEQVKRIIENIARPTGVYRFVGDLPLEGYIARQNKKNFVRQLKAETDPEMRRILRRLLAIETAKLEKMLAEQENPGQGEHV